MTEDVEGLPHALRPTDFQGLLLSAGKHIAFAPKADHSRERLDAVDSPEAFRSFLEDTDLGFAAPAKKALIEAVTGEDWETHYNRLHTATNNSRVDRMSPNS